MFRAAVKVKTARNEDCAQLNHVIGLLARGATAAAQEAQPAQAPSPTRPAAGRPPCPCAENKRGASLRTSHAAGRPQ
eukprot:15893154-Heterocapsa_arctica.AAC.1